jgi:hypothetical protein
MSALEELLDHYRKTAKNERDKGDKILDNLQNIDKTYIDLLVAPEIATLSLYHAYEIKSVGVVKLVLFKLIIYIFVETNIN